MKAIIRTFKDIVSDEDVERVHGNANFGQTSKREVLNEGVMKAAFGFHCGSTMRNIIYEHGLIRTCREPGDRMRLTKKGEKYLRLIVWGRFDKMVKLTLEDGK